MRLSDVIEAFIKDTMDKTEGEVSIQRNELATFFNCVPSQINYVIATRFTNDRGYYVESRRGGGGSIRIRRVDMRDVIEYLMHIVASLSDSISRQSAEIYIDNFLGYKVVTPRECALLKAALSDKVLGGFAQPDRDSLRAAILKNMLMAIITA
jgi:transcriptional regulator CtsR